MITFVLNVPINRNYGYAIAVQDLKEFMYETFSDFPPLELKNFGAAPVYSIISIFISC